MLWLEVVSEAGKENVVSSRGGQKESIPMNDPPLTHSSGPDNGPSELAFYREFFEHAPVGCVTLSAAGVIKIINHAGAKLLGAAHQDLAGRVFGTLMAEAEREAWGRFLVAVFASGPRQTCELTLTIEGGAPVAVQVKATASPDGLECRAVLIDITERLLDQAIVACRTEVLQKIAQAAPLKETLTLMLQHVEAVLPEMLCSVLLLDADGRHLRHGAAPSLPPEFMAAIDGTAIGPAVGSCGTAAFRRETVIVADIATDPLWTDFRDLALPHGLRACWSTPISDDHGEVLGTFAIYFRQAGLPAAAHQQCISLVVDLASVAIHRERVRAELQVCKERYHRVVSSSIIGAFMAHTDGRITEANDLFLKMVGHSRADLTAGRLRWDAMTPPEWREVDEHILRELAAHGSCQPVEKEYLHRNGSRVPVLVAVALIEGKSGDCICLINDLSKRMQAEHALQEREEQLRLYVEHVPAAIAMLDRDMRYLVVSQRWREDYHLGDVPLVGRSHYEVFPDLPPRWIEVHQRCLAGAVEQCDTDPFPRADGKTDWIHWEIRPWHQADGTIGGIIIFTEDITARRESDAAIQRYETIFRQAGWGMAVSDPETNVLTHVNPAFARMHGYEVAEMIGMHLAEMFTPEARAAVPQHVQAVQDKGRHIYESMHLRKDGSVFPCLTDVTVFKDEAGRVVFRAATFEDVTESKRAEQVLRESEEKFSKAFRNSPDAILLTTLDGEILDANPGFRRLTGHAFADVSGRTTTEIGFWADQADRQRFITALLEHGRAAEMEAQFCRCDGALRICLISGELMELDGRPIILGVVRDITERRLAEAALLESQSHLTALMDSVDGIVWEVDAATFQFTFVSPSAERLLGYPLAQWTEEPTFWSDHIHPDDREHAVGYCLTCTQSKQDHEFTYRMIAADGRAVWMRDIVTLVMENGEPVKLRGIMTDITAHKQAEAERERLLNVLEASLNEIYIFDEQTLRFQYVNDCARRHLGYSMDTMRELTPLDLKPEHDLASFAALVAPLRRHDKEQVIFETVHRCADGRLYPVEVHLQLVEQGGPAVFLAVINDITERQQAEQQLRALMARLQQAREEERVRVSREIHDELGQLLTGLKMDVRWLERKLSEPGLPAEFNPLLDRTVAASELADTTIATVQKIAAKLRPGALDQLGLAAALSQEARRFQARSDVTCVVSGEDSWPTLSPSVASELFYIVQEALTNVARHAQARQVEIFLSVAGGEAVIEVCDDGVGMDTSVMKKTSSLGLLGMKERAAQCGGTVTFSPNMPQGLRVTVRVPVTNDERSSKRDEDSTGG